MRRPPSLAPHALRRAPIARRWQNTVGALDLLYGLVPAGVLLRTRRTCGACSNRQMISHPPHLLGRACASLGPQPGPPPVPSGHWLRQSGALAALLGPRGPGEYQACVEAGLIGPLADALVMNFLHERTWTPIRLPISIHVHRWAAALEAETSEIPRRPAALLDTLDLLTPEALKIVRQHGRYHVDSNMLQNTVVAPSA